MVAEHKIIEGSDEILFNLAAIYMLTNLGAGPHFGNEVTRRQAAGILEEKRQIGAPALHGNPPLRRTVNNYKDNQHKIRKLSD